MEDEQIIDLYFKRSEQAISETDHKYGRQCRKTSFNFVHSQEDADECVNDSYLAVWNTVPPQRPNPLVAYLLRIVKNLSLKKYRTDSAEKRNSSFDLCLEELQECLPSSYSVSEAVDLKLTIEHFLDELDADSRVMFVRRYWYADPVKDIAGKFHMSEANAAIRLYRIRKELREYLEGEGITL